jgi:putative YhbY family RNA-binding protein
MLTAPQRKALRARAYKLDPIVQIGGKGLTGEVLAEIERALKAHELIKVRAGTAERDERDRMLEEICEKTGAAAVQQVGKVFVIYRKKAE